MASERASWAGSPSDARMKVRTGTAREGSAQLFTAADEPHRAKCCSKAYRTGLVQGPGAASKSWTGLHTQTKPPIQRRSVNARCCFRALAFT